MTLKYFLLAAFLLCAQSASAGTIAGTASVIDGDTIEIHGQRIRLQAIDAIEAGQLCTLPTGKKWRCGKDSALALSDKIGRAPVSCQVSDFDRYGRAVAVCFLGKTDLNAWMVRNGWAVAYRKYGTQYVQHEAKARNQGLGIWASGFEMPWDWRRAKRGG